MEEMELSYACRNHILLNCALGEDWGNGPLMCLDPETYGSCTEQPRFDNPLGHMEAVRNQVERDRDLLDTMAPLAEAVLHGDQWDRTLAYTQVDLMAQK